MNCFNIVVFLLKSFSVTVGTIFHHTNLELQKWFLAIALILNAKKGISTRQLAKYHDLAEHIIIFKLSVGIKSFASLKKEFKILCFK